MGWTDDEDELGQQPLCPSYTPPPSPPPRAPQKPPKEAASNRSTERAKLARSRLTNFGVLVFLGFLISVYYSAWLRCLACLGLLVAVMDALAAAERSEADAAEPQMSHIFGLVLVGAFVSFHCRAWLSWLACLAFLLYLGIAMDDLVAIV